MADEYRPEFARLAYNYCLLGATDNQMALFFDTTANQVRKWREVIPEFDEAVREGKEIADAKVAEALYRRACGYDYLKKSRGQNGKVTATMVHVPPDVVACIFWLKNRQKGLWVDKVEHELNKGNVLDAANISDVEIARRVAFMISKGVAGKDLVKSDAE